MNGGGCIQHLCRMTIVYKPVKWQIYYQDLGEVSGMPNSITNRQMFFILFLTLTTYTTINLPQLMAQAVGRSSWIPLLIAAVIFATVAVIITKLNYMFKGMVLFDYSQIILGKFFSYLIAIYYIAYFLFFGVYFKLRMEGLLTSNFLPKTPPYVLILTGVLLFGYVAYKGITNIARMFEIIGALFLIVTTGICLRMLSQGMSDNILPFFNKNEAREFLSQSQHFIAPYRGLEVLLVIPFTSINKKAPKVAFFTLLGIGVFYVLIVESTIMTLGINNTIALNDALIEAVKIVSVPVLERLDIFYLTFGLASLFTGMIIVYTCIVEFACKILPKVKRLYIVISVGALLSVLCILAINIHDLSTIYENIAWYFILISSVLIPTTLFIIAKVRKLAVK